MEKEKGTEQHRRIADLVFPHIYRVKASAGSGKTNALSDRFVKLLLSKQIKKNSLENIIAITFTNKAVVEMKERILRKLKVVYFSNDSKNDRDFVLSIARETGLERDRLRDIVEKEIDKIIADYTHFQVKTIDSMISYISKISASDLGLPPDFELNFNLDESVDYALSKMVSEITEDNNIYEKIMNFIMYDLETQNRYVWQPIKAIKSGIKNYIDLQYSIGVELSYNKVETKKISKLKSKIISIAKEIRDITNQKKIKLKKNYEKRINEIIDEGKIGLNKVRIEMEKLLNKENKDYGYLFKDDVGKINKAFCEYVELLAESSDQRFLTFSESVHRDIDAFIRKNGIISLNDLTNRLKIILKEAYIPEIFYKLGNTYYHYMIDEFQDTSRVQWEIIKSLVENVIAENGSFFYVGDVKQAIYRFRGGDISLFSEIFDSYKTKVACYDDFLYKNYRSAKEIVEFNNEMFSEKHIRDFLSGENNDLSIEQIVKIYKNAKQEPYKQDKEGYVSVERCSEIDEIQNEKVPDTIRKILDNGYSKSDICILVRKNDEGENIANILMEKGYDVIFSKVAKVNENHLINEIISFLKFLNNPMDKLSFFSFVFGDIFGRKAGLRRDSIYDFAFDCVGNKLIYSSFKEKFPDIWNNEFNPFLQYINYLPLYDTVSEIIKHFNIIEEFPGSEAYLMKLLEIIKDMGEKGDLSVDEVTEKWENAERNRGENEQFDILIPEYIDAINIMTVHKAKGLSFPIVIIPYAILDTGGEGKNRIYLEHNKDSVNILKINKSYTQYSERLKRIYSEEKTREIIDRLNRMYVAMTRAENVMFIYTLNGEENNNKRKGKEDDRFFFPNDSKSVYRGKMVKKPRRKEKEKTNQNNCYPRAHIRWYQNLAFNGEDAIFDPRRREAISRGEIYHKMLEEIEILSIQSMEVVIEKLSHKYRLEIEEVRGILDFIINDNLLSKLYTGNIIVFNEKEVATGEDDVYRLDRVVFRDNKIYVIDYKTGESYREKHKSQIVRYMKIMKEIYGKKCIGVLIYLDEKRKMLIYG